MADGGGQSQQQQQQCFVTTFIGCDQAGLSDDVGTAAKLLHPLDVSYSRASNSLVFIQNSESGDVRRVSLPAKPTLKARIARYISSALADIAKSLSDISPLINLIVSYAASAGGMSRSLSLSRNPVERCCSLLF